MNARPNPDFDNLLDALRQRAARAEGGLVWYGSSGGLEEKLSLTELLRSAFGVAAAADLPPGARVALVYQPGLAFVRAFFGAVAAGLVPVTLVPPARGSSKRMLPRIDALLEGAQVSAVWTDENTARQLERFVPAGSKLAQLRRLLTDRAPARDDDGRAGPSPDGLALLQYNSGSTRAPRGARLTHANLLHNSRAIQGATSVTWLPPQHAMGLIAGVIQPVVSGGEAVLLSPAAFIRSPRTWLELISKHRARHSAAPSFAFELCVRRISDTELTGLDLSAWDAAFCGPEPIRADVLRKFAVKFARAGFRAEALAPCYGLTEATLLVTATPAGSGLRTIRVDAAKLSRGIVEPAAEGGQELASSGRPISNTTLSIRALADGAQLEHGVGEIVVESPSVAAGHHGDAPEAQRSFGERGLRTGDLGFVDGGDLYVLGRIDELLITRGRQLQPFDLESLVIEEVRGVRAGRVVAGSLSGAEPHAVVLAERTARGVDSARLVSEIQTSVRRQFGVALEAAILPLGSIHFTASGKLQRLPTLAAVARGEIVPLAVSAGLASLWARTDSAQAKDPLEQHEILRAMVRELAPLLRVRPEELDVDRSLLELGLDSLAAAEFQAEIQQTYAVEVSMAYLASGASLRALALALEQARASGTKVLRAPTARAPEPVIERDSEGPASRIGSLPQSRAVISPSLFFFESSDVGETDSKRPMYADLEASVQFAESAGFEAVWLPERHFHPFGAPFPNPAILAAALAVKTSQIGLRAGSVVLPLHHPARVAEEWAMVDRLSAGRVALSFTSGWSPRDYVLRASEFESRQAVLFDRIEQVRALWRGESHQLPDGHNRPAVIETHPRPFQRELPVWLTCTEKRVRFEEAGQRGFNVLTALLFHDAETLAGHIAAYRAARAAAKLDRGHVTLAVHTFVGESDAHAREVVREPLVAYLESSANLWQQRASALGAMTREDKAKALDYATERYLAVALIGSSEVCSQRLTHLASIGVDEVACQIDFGIGRSEVSAGLGRLAELWD